MTRKKAIVSVINDKTQVNHSFDRSTCKKKPRLCCYYNEYNGNLVDSCTKKLDNLKEQNSANNSSNESTMNYNMNMIQKNKLESIISYKSSILALHQFS